MRIILLQIKKLRRKCRTENGMERKMEKEME
jgi:hypothetical protein